MWKKAEITKWLSDNNVQFDPCDTKNVLLARCKSHKMPPSYVIDEFCTGETQHKILRLPPYHFFYNAIEMVWGIAKRHFDDKIGLFHNYSDEMVAETWKSALETVTPEIWEKCVLKVERRIASDYEKMRKDKACGTSIPPAKSLESVDSDAEDLAYLSDERADNVETKIQRALFPQAQMVFSCRFFNTLLAKCLS